jgi:hypothetical protein
VALHSYSSVRYRSDGTAEGVGGGSPFAMGLHGLVTKGSASLTEDLRIWGELREQYGEEEARSMRVPDQTMMLNTLLRMVVDKAERLQSFRQVIRSPAYVSGLTFRRTDGS